MPREPITIHEQRFLNFEFDVISLVSWRGIFLFIIMVQFEL